MGGAGGRAACDPAKLADALIRIVAEDPPPRRFLAGADAVALAERKARMLLEESDAHRDLSTSMAHDDDGP